MIPFRAKVGAARFRELMAELTSAIDNIDSDQGGGLRFLELLGPELFARYQAELVETLETGSDPGAFWAKLDRRSSFQSGLCARIRCIGNAGCRVPKRWNARTSST